MLSVHSWFAQYVYASCENGWTKNKNKNGINNFGAY